MLFSYPEEVGWTGDQMLVVQDVFLHPTPSEYTANQPKEEYTANQPKE